MRSPAYAVAKKSVERDDAYEYSSVKNKCSSTQQVSPAQLTRILQELQYHYRSMELGGEALVGQT